MAPHAENHAHEGPDCGCGTASLKGLTQGQIAHINESPRTVQISCVPGTTASYSVPFDLSRSKPTLVMLHSFGSDGTLYRPQFTNKHLREAVNFVTVDLLGHGRTRTTTKEWTSWDSAKMTLELIDRIGIQKTFIMGTDHGAWTAMQMALLASEKINGVIVIGSSFAKKSTGGWDNEFMTPFSDRFSALSPTPDFQLPNDFIEHVLGAGFGACLSEPERTYWTSRLRHTYAGDDGRRQLLRAIQVFRDGGGLESRAAEIECPVLWLQGKNDDIFPVGGAREGIGSLKGSRKVRLEIIDDGAHLLSVTHAEVVGNLVREFVQEYN